MGFSVLSLITHWLDGIGGRIATDEERVAILMRSAGYPRSAMPDPVTLETIAMNCRFIADRGTETFTAVVQSVIAWDMVLNVGEVSGSSILHVSDVLMGISACGITSGDVVAVGRNALPVIVAGGHSLLDASDMMLSTANRGYRGEAMAEAIRAGIIARMLKDADGVTP